METTLFAVAVGLVLGQAPFALAETVTESAREVPVAYDVDVVVIGGSTGAVSAAVEAAARGATVFLAAPRPYLGEDVCSTYRLWLEPGEEPKSSLAKQVFAEPPPALAIEKGAPFRYQADLASAAIHNDTDPPSVLSDGVWGNAASQSVEFDGDVTITLDLANADARAPVALSKVHVVSFLCWAGTTSWWSAVGQAGRPRPSTRPGTAPRRSWSSTSTASGAWARSVLSANTIMVI